MGLDLLQALFLKIERSVDNFTGNTAFIFKQNGSLGFFRKLEVFSGTQSILITVSRQPSRGT